MTKWIKETRPSTCDWWQTEEYPDEPVWHTQCGRCGRDERDQALAVESMRNFEADYCPWCGGERSEVDFADVEAEWRADWEQREEVRRMRL